MNAHDNMTPPDRAECEILDPVWIPMPDGTRLAARIWLPRSAHHAPVPAVLEYLPYRRRDGTLARDEITYPWLAAQGYAGVRVDIRGNGDSEGQMEDEYTETELADGEAVVAWIAAQPWCTGAVGMIGISWGGFNGLQLAARAPNALKAAITICFTDDRYADDIHYMGGCLLTENMMWSSQMLAYSSRPPDPDIVGPDWRDTWRTRLHAQPLLIEPWLTHPHRDAYWRRASVCEDFNSVKAAIMAVGGWADAYSNAVPRTLAGLSSPAAGLVGPWAHKYPNTAWPSPQIGFLTECKAWFDRYLKGDTTAPEAPAYRFFIKDSIAPSREVAAQPGRWAAEPAWPSPRIAPRDWSLAADGLRDGVGQGGDSLVVATPQTLGRTAQRFCPGMRSLDELAADQTPDDAAALTLDSAPLPEGVDIVGAARLRLWLTPDQTSGFVVARLCDLRPDGTSAFVTMGVLNLAHRAGHDAPAPMQPGLPVDVEVTLNDIAYHLPRGHRLRLALSTSYWPMIWPSAQPLGLTINGENSLLSVPVRPRSADADTPAPTFATPEQQRVGGQDVLRSDRSDRIEEVRPDGIHRLRLITDGGKQRHHATGIEIGRHLTETWDIHPDDPLTARTEAHWIYEVGRGDWQTRTESNTVMTCDATHFHVRAWLKAHEGDDLVADRAWSLSIPRGDAWGMNDADC